ncbi:helix-turn-helix domain-containing protein [Winogradskyella schleiferi]|uniref:helix-turn-helix domain-containing protein n=1 Tax=Winogradskyella schleiferi TaxID=2686078 RepID=UPI0015B9769C|nr:helix-turn-helix domain-containing protein [Winogradskyella schleiferi]
MNYDSIIRLIILIGIVQGFVFNAFVFLNRKKINISIKYLNIVVLCLSLNNLREFVYDGNYLSGVILYIYLAVPWHFLIVPFFYIFLIYYLKIKDEYPNYLKFTLLIFSAEILIRTGLMLFSKDFEVRFSEYIIVEEICNAIYAVFIFYHIIKLVFFDKNASSKITPFDDIKWIKAILKAGAGIMVLWIITVIIYYFTREAWLYDPLKIIYSILIYWLGYQGLIHSKTTNERIDIRQQIENREPNTILEISSEKQNAKLKEKHRADFETIKTYVIDNKRFLDPFFSMDLLSEELNISNSHLSKVINTYSTYNFSDFINSLRVQQAKKLLLSDRFKQYTIVAIGLECGFNSKSTFYSAFKKFTSETPTSYRSRL